MVVLGGGRFLVSEVPLYSRLLHPQRMRLEPFSPEDALGALFLVGWSVVAQ